MVTYKTLLINIFKKIGTTYIECTTKIRSVTDAPFERNLPISSIDLNLESFSHLNKRIVNNTKVIMMNTYSFIPGTKINIKEV